MTGSRPEQIAAGVKNFLASRVDGILMTDELRDHTCARALTKRKFPVMTFDTPSREGFSAVCADYSRTLPAALRHLAARGRRRITFLLSASGSLLSEQLQTLFCNSCLELGLEPECFPDASLEEMSFHAERRPEAVLVYGNYKLIRFLRRAAELPGYHPDAVGFFNPWSWHPRQPGLSGAIMAPQNAFLSWLGCDTLALRMERHSSNAKAVAAYLDKHPKIDWVLHASLPNNRYHAIAQKYLPNGQGGMLSFGIKGDVHRAAAFMEGLQLIAQETHVADVRSCVLHPASTTHRQLSKEELVQAGVPENLVRLSVGIEHPDDILADLDQALAKI